MIDFEVARDKLLNFETADELAEYFQECGIKATPGKSSSCAIAVWMQDQTGQDVKVSIYNMWSAQSGARGHNITLATFATRFDLGRYPQLIKWD